MLPLDGIKVVDLAQIFMGPGAAVHMADQGAEVIKVEPIAGDAIRWRYTMPHLKGCGFGKGFLAFNRNKRGIAVELRTAEGQEIVHRLAKQADVFIQNFRPGAEVPVRMDYPTLATLNPRLIYAAISALGRDGPEASSPGYDVVLQARIGMLSQHRNTDGAPLPSKVFTLDMAGSMGLAYAIMVALWEREKTGKGQRIDMDLLHVGLLMQTPQMVFAENPESRKSGGAAEVLISCCQCADDQWIILVVAENHQFTALCKVLELEHLTDDPTLATVEKRINLAPELRDMIEAVLRTRPSDQWLRSLREAGVPHALVAEPYTVPEDPQVVANKMLLTQDHPVAGRVTMVAPPFHLSNTFDETRLRRPAPKLGEHTVEVLRECGYDEATIAGFHERSIVR